MKVRDLRNSLAFVDQDAELVFEAHPDDLNYRKVEGYRRSHAIGDWKTGKLAVNLYGPRDVDSETVDVVILV